MIEEQAVVVKCDEQYVWVQTQRQSSCGHCSVKNGCGTQLLAKVLGNKTTYVRCLNPARLDTEKRVDVIKKGDRVLIGLQESALLNGSFLMYFLPIMSMIFAAGLAVFVAKNYWPQWVDLFSIVAAISGLVIGFKMSRFFSHSRTHSSTARLNMYSNTEIAAQYEPVILKKLSTFVPLSSINIQYDN